RPAVARLEIKVTFVVQRATTGRPYRQREKPLLSVTDQTKISMSLFTIKKKPVVACCPRVSTSLLN
ncbi:MAG: hypothetical protein J6M03_01000, partial [Clostridia bacterium]|nr:hypothetical protein [Clostridia bacterium]